MRRSHRVVAVATLVVVATTGWATRPATAAATLGSTTLASTTLASTTSGSAALVTANLGIYRNVSVVDTASRKSISVPCPNGLKVYGAGGQVDGGNGHVVLDEIVPNDALTSVTVEAIEYDIWVGVWSVTAWAVCGTPVGNQQRVRVQSANDSTSPKNAVAVCPAPLRLYGMGAELTNGQGQVFLDDYDVDSGLTQANAGGYENGTVTGNWSVISYAICGDAATTMVRTSSSSPQDGNPMKDQASPECPVGTVLHGMGAEVTGGLGEVMLDHLMPWPTIYTGSLTDARAVEVVGSSPAAPTWTLTSYAICIA